RDPGALRARRGARLRGRAPDGNPARIQGHAQQHGLGAAFRRRPRAARTRTARAGSQRRGGRHRLGRREPRRPDDPTLPRPLPPRDDHVARARVRRVRAEHAGPRDDARRRQRPRANRGRRDRKAGAPCRDRAGVPPRTGRRGDAMSWVFGHRVSSALLVFVMGCASAPAEPREPEAPIEAAPSTASAEEASANDAPASDAPAEAPEAPEADETTAPSAEPEPLPQAPEPPPEREVRYVVNPEGMRVRTECVVLSARAEAVRAGKRHAVRATVRLLMEADTERSCLA